MTESRFSGRYAVVIEVPKGSFIKRRPDQSIDFVSPLPCPFNYGSVPDTLSEDGDPLDAVVLGPTIKGGDRVQAQLLGWVDFVDAGDADPKLILGRPPLAEQDRLRVERFFRFYAVAKKVLNRARGLKGPTEYRGFKVEDAAK